MCIGFIFWALHDDLDEGSQQRRVTLLALSRLCEIVQRSDTTRWRQTMSFKKCNSGSQVQFYVQFLPCHLTDRLFTIQTLYERQIEPRNLCPQQKRRRGSGGGDWVMFAEFARGQKADEFQIPDDDLWLLHFLQRWLCTMTVVLDWRYNIRTASLLRNQKRYSSFTATY